MSTDCIAERSRRRLPFSFLPSSVQNRVQNRRRSVGFRPRYRIHHRTNRRLSVQSLPDDSSHHCRYSALDRHCLTNASCRLDPPSDKTSVTTYPKELRKISADRETRSFRSKLQELLYLCPPISDRLLPSLSDNQRVCPIRHLNTQDI